MIKYFENLLIFEINLFFSLFSKEVSNLMIHLGMSGTIHLINKSRKKNSITNTSFYHSPLLPKKHNHVEIKIDNFKLIYNDPRRFGYFQFLDDFNSLKKKFQNFLGF